MPIGVANVTGTVIFGILSGLRVGSENRPTNVTKINSITVTSSTSIPSTRTITVYAQPLEVSGGSYSKLEANKIATVSFNGTTTGTATIINNGIAFNNCQNLECTIGGSGTITNSTKITFTITYEYTKSKATKGKKTFSLTSKTMSTVLHYDTKYEILQRINYVYVDRTGTYNEWLIGTAAGYAGGYKIFDIEFDDGTKYAGQASTGQFINVFPTQNDIKLSQQNDITITFNLTSPTSYDGSFGLELGLYYTPEDSKFGYYNGSQFVNCTIRGYDGSSFVPCTAMYYDGTQWLRICK